MKRIAIIGRGTAGCLSAAYLTKVFPNYEIKWYFDPSILPQSVGEGSTTELPILLYHTLNFTHNDLNKIDGTPKFGILKEGWGEGNSFIHHFNPPGISYHFNAVKLQDFVLNKLKNKIKIIEGNANVDNIDADNILDCSGKPKTYDEYCLSKYIPVNSVHVNQCYWDYPRFFNTLTIARPYGWVFGIPLQNRCSIGYLYNNNINSLKDIKDDIKEVFEKYNLTPSEDYNSFSFKNYYRKENFSNRVAYNGNASFFLEPIEATSIALMCYLQEGFASAINTNNIVSSNIKYHVLIKQIESIIMLHYFSGSIYNTDFWRFAQEKGILCIEEAIKTPSFVKMIKGIKDIDHEDSIIDKRGYGSWWGGSFLQNLHGLGIYEKLMSMI